VVPTDLVGRTAGLLIQSLDRVPADVVTAAGRATAGRLVSRDGTIRVAVRDAAVLVTAAHNHETETAVRAMLASATLGGSSGVFDLCSTYDDARYTRVDHLFFGWWNCMADTDAGSYCPDAYYANRQRIHQYTGDTYETWGGVRVCIVRDYLDVTTGMSEPPPTGFAVTVDNSTAGGFTATANWGTSTYSAQRIGPDYRFASPVSSSDVAWWRSVAIARRVHPGRGATRTRWA
jgi:hypothetical protein